EQRVFKLLRKHTLPANHRKRIILHVARSLDDFDVNVELRIQGPQTRTRLFSLPQREFGTTRPDDEWTRHPPSVLETRRIFSVNVRLAGFVEATHLADDRVRDLVYGRQKQRLDRSFLIFRQHAEPFPLLRELRTRNVLHVLSQRADARP